MSAANRLKEKYSNITNQVNLAGREYLDAEQVEVIVDGLLAEISALKAEMDTDNEVILEQ